MNIAAQNATALTAINAAGITYTVRKYAGAWVPVVIKDGTRYSFAHCSTSGGAMQIAINKATKIAEVEAAS